MQIHLNRWLAATTVLCALAAPAIAPAETWPARPVTIIVPFPAGGNADILARALAQELSVKHGKQFIVDNRGGAGGNIGALAVARAAPDGHTLLFTSPAPIAQNRLMYKNMPFDPDRDFRPIVLIASLPVIVAAKQGVPFKSLPEAIAFAKANPGKLTIGVPGQGTLGHITSELLQTTVSINLTSVPYRGSTPLLNDLLGGQIDLAVDFMSTYIAMVREGKIVPLAVTSAQRSPELPDVPTVAEIGIVKFEASAWFALLGPAGLPSDVVQKINASTNDWLESAPARKVLAPLSMRALGGTPQQLKAHIDSEVAKWGPVIKAANIQF